jgi:lipopolysaccharide export system protein LptA
MLKSIIVIASLSIFCIPAAVQAKTTQNKNAEIKFEANEIIETSPNTKKLTGNVIIRSGKSEFKTDQALMKLNKNKIYSFSSKEFILKIK